MHLTLGVVHNASNGSGYGGLLFPKHTYIPDSFRAKGRGNPPCDCF